jgi:hypothetical protein
MSVNTLATPDHEPSKDRTGLASESQLESLSQMARKLLNAAQPLKGTEGLIRGDVGITFEDDAAHYAKYGADGSEIDLFITPDEDDGSGNNNGLNVTIDTLRSTGRKPGEGAYTYERKHYPLTYGEHTGHTIETGDIDADDNFFHGNGDWNELPKGEMTAEDYARLDKALNDLLGPDVQLRPDLPERQPS